MVSVYGLALSFYQNIKDVEENVQTKQKEIIINGKTIKFTFNVRTWAIYCNTFGTSPENDIDSIDFNTDAGLLRATVLVFPQIMWALAKTANPAIPSVGKWYKSLGPFNCIETFEELVELFPGAGVTING